MAANRGIAASRVYALCYWFTGSPVDSEDLTQDVFLKVYRNLKTFTWSAAAFKSWLTALTRNLLVDHFRRTGPSRRHTRSMRAGTIPTSLPWRTRWRQELDPLQRSMDRQLQNLVQKALLQVSQLRQAVILRDLEDMDYKENRGGLADSGRHGKVAHQRRERGSRTSEAAGT